MTDKHVTAGAEYSTLEPGLDARIDQFGRLQIATNTPTGHVYQELSFRPSTALRLYKWLQAQDWKAIEETACAIDPQAKYEFAEVASLDEKDGKGC